VDPLTLFALANGAVNAVKAGCKLYRDIKGAAGEVKDVLKDLDDQFHKLHPPEKPATNEQKKQFLEEKERIKELNKKANNGETSDAYDQIAEQLSVYFENYAKCVAIWEEEERHAQEVYSGDASVGKRALQRVVMRKKLEQMGVELREMLVYQSPPELGALYSDVSAMMEKISIEQSAAIAKKMSEDRAARIKRRKRIDQLWVEATWGVGAIIVAATVGLMFAFVIEDRINKYPHLGNEIIPKTEAQRRKDAEPKVYIGR
jgi:hypothetical protein